MFCTQCGSKNDESGSFCQKCGSKLIQPSTTISSVPTKTEIPPKAKKPLLFITLAILVIIAVGVGGFFFIRNISSSPKPEVLYETAESEVSAKPNVSIRPEVGNTFMFGDYRWIVLAVENDKTLIITQDIIEFREYHIEDVNMTWADCTLRAYLNGYFYDTFTDEEQAQIIETLIENADNQWYGTDGGVNTMDKVFLLSLDEVAKYFGDSSRKLSNWNGEDYYISDQYDADRMAYDSTGFDAIWYLRSPGRGSTHAAKVYYGGKIEVGDSGVSHGYPPDMVHGGLSVKWGIRPAMWVKQ